METRRVEQEQEDMIMLQDGIQTDLHANKTLENSCIVIFRFPSERYEGIGDDLAMERVTILSRLQ